MECLWGGYRQFNLQEGACGVGRQADRGFRQGLPSANHKGAFISADVYCIASHAVVAGQVQVRHILIGYPGIYRRAALHQVVFCIQHRVSGRLIGVVEPFVQAAVANEVAAIGGDGSVIKKIGKFRAVGVIQDGVLKRKATHTGQIDTPAVITGNGSVEQL